MLCFTYVQSRAFYAPRPINKHFMSHNIAVLFLPIAYRLCIGFFFVCQQVSPKARQGQYCVAYCLNITLPWKTCRLADKCMKERKNCFGRFVCVLCEFAKKRKYWRELCGSIQTHSKLFQFICPGLPIYKKWKKQMRQIKADLTVIRWLNVPLSASYMWVSRALLYPIVGFVIYSHGRSLKEGIKDDSNL